MNWSVPLSPPLMTAAAIRTPTTSTIIAQNSVVLNEAFVSWFRSLMAARMPPPRGASTRVLPVAPVVAMGNSFLGWGSAELRRNARGRAAALLSSPRRVVATAPSPARHTECPRHVRANTPGRYPRRLDERLAANPGDTRQPRRSGGQHADGQARARGSRLRRGGDREARVAQSRRQRQGPDRRGDDRRGRGGGPDRAGKEHHRRADL